LFVCFVWFVVRRFGTQERSMSVVTAAVKPGGDCARGEEGVTWVWEWLEGSGAPADRLGYVERRRLACRASRSR
jgi:hypothetical protein